MHPLGKSLILVGIFFIIVGLLVAFAPSFPWLGRLPGDFRIERPGSRLYFPLATCLILSALLSLVLLAISRLR